MIPILVSIVVSLPACQGKQKAEESWWKIESMKPTASKQALPTDTKLHLRSDGTFVSDGFFGNGTWKRRGEDYLLYNDKWFVGSRAIGTDLAEMLKEGDPKITPVVLQRHDQILRLQIKQLGKGTMYWYEFKKFVP